MKLYFFLCSALFSNFAGLAQFQELASYEDPAFKKMIKTQHVRTVSEVEARATYTFFVGRYTFDTLGRVIERFRGSGPKVRIEYNNKNQVSKTIVYDGKDSSKVEYWINREYDEKGRVMKEETVTYQDGKEIVSIREETKIFTLPNGKKRKETYKGYGIFPTDTVFSTDSISGIYEFNICYEKSRNEENEEGLQRSKKILTREYFLNNCFYSEEIEYTVYGRLETPREIKGQYNQTDAKGDLLESGEMDYEKVFATYFEAHPEDFNMYILPPNFIRQILNNKIKGEKKPYIRNTYNSKGLLIEKLFFGTTYKFKYNTKGQAIEQTGIGSSNTTNLLYYNEKGLVSKMITIYLNPNEDPPKKETTEDTFTYTYY